MYAKGKSYVKAASESIRHDPVKLSNLQSFGVSIDQYEFAYQSMVLRGSAKLSYASVLLITSRRDFIPYLHLYRQPEVISAVDELAAKGSIRRIVINGANQYIVKNGQTMSIDIGLQHLGF